MEVCCCNGTLRMQGIAANQRRTAKEMITYSKLGGSNLYCKCSPLEDVITWGLPRTSICLLSHELVAGDTQGFDFQRGSPPFGSKNFNTNPMEDAEPTLGPPDVAWRYGAPQEHLHGASTSHPSRSSWPAVKQGDGLHQGCFDSQGSSELTNPNGICTNPPSHRPPTLPPYNTLIRQKT